MRNFSLYFNYHKDPEDVHPQIDMGLSELGILLLHTPPHDAPSKGKVERPFHMFQGRDRATYYTREEDKSISYFAVKHFLI